LQWGSRQFGAFFCLGGPPIGRGNENHQRCPAFGKISAEHCSPRQEAALHADRARQGSYVPPVHMIKLTKEREITLYVWVHLDDER
jgi:hypothetical protein